MNLSIDALRKTMTGRFPEHLGLRLVEITADRVRGELDVEEHHCTTPGILHGGALMAVADTLGAYGTAIQIPRGARTTTLESKTNFFAAVRSKSTLYGESVPLHRGRQTMVWRTTLRSSDSGSLAAVVTQTQMILLPPPGAEEALEGLFRGKSQAETRRLLARIERAGATLLEALAEAETDPARKSELLESSRREQLNAAVLETQALEQRGSVS